MPERVTLRIIAEACGVSLNAVSLALRNHPRISESTRQRIQNTARELGYTQDPLVAAGMARLRQKKASPGSVLAVLHQMSRAQIKKAEANLSICRGIELRAQELGFSIEHFYPLEDGISYKRLHHILKSRGILGVILMIFNEQPDQAFSTLLNDFPACSVGHLFQSLTLPNVTVDHFVAGKIAVAHVLRMNYRRPGLLLNEEVDRTLGKGYTGGFLTATCMLPKSRQLDVLGAKFIGQGDQRDLGRAWYERVKPDVVLTNQIVATPDEFRAAFGLPKALPCVRVNVPENTLEWAGVQNPFSRVGATTVNQVVAQLHQGGRSEGDVQIAHLIQPRWVDGQSCPPMKLRRKG